jgi:hypothetical protein
MIRCKAYRRLWRLSGKLHRYISKKAIEANKALWKLNGDI